LLEIQKPRSSSIRHQNRNKM